MILVVLTGVSTVYLRIFITACMAFFYRNKCSLCDYKGYKCCSLSLPQLYGKPNGHAQKAVMVQRGQVVGTRNTSVCSENVSSVFSYWLFSIQSYKISQGSYAWVDTDICIVKE